MGRIAFALVVVTLFAGPHAEASTERSRALVAALEKLDSRLTGSLDSAERRAVHEEKAEIFAHFFNAEERALLEGLDCVATRVQMARAGRARAHVRVAATCLKRSRCDAAGFVRAAAAAARSACDPGAHPPGPRLRRARHRLAPEGGRLRQGAPPP